MGSTTITQKILIMASIVLPGLPIALLEETLDQLAEGMNISAAAWFMQAIANYP